jgi:hypothetical protein
MTKMDFNTGMTVIRGKNGVKAVIPLENPVDKIWRTLYSKRAKQARIHARAQNDKIVVALPNAHRQSNIFAILDKAFNLIVETDGDYAMLMRDTIRTETWARDWYRKG